MSASATQGGHKKSVLLAMYCVAYVQTMQ